MTGFRGFGRVGVVAQPDQKPLTTAEVAAIFGVTAGTVIQWANAGKLRSFRTPGGRRRFERRDVEHLRWSGVR